MLKLLRNLVHDEEGAALVEYTVLLAIMLIATIAIIIAVGSWVVNGWTALCNTVSSTNAACNTP